MEGREWKKKSRRKQEEEQKEASWDRVIVIILLKVRDYNIPKGDFLFSGFYIP